MNDALSRGDRVPMFWCAPREPETLWSVRANGRRTDCVIVGVGELGWEIRLMSDGSEFFARRWILRAEALAEADELRRGCGRS
jgi:hypothetical protein